MSKLYLTGQADKKKVFTKVAKTRLGFEVLWGKKQEPKLAAEIEITWPRNQFMPTIRLKHPESIKLEEVSL